MVTTCICLTLKHPVANINRVDYAIKGTYVNCIYITTLTQGLVNDVDLRH